MKKLIYYKICLKNGTFIEANAKITIDSTIMSEDEWHKFNRDAREWNNTYSAPIIMNIMDIR